MFEIIAQGVGENLPLIMELNGATFKSPFRLNFLGMNVLSLVPRLDYLGPTVLTVTVNSARGGKTYGYDDTIRKFFCIHCIHRVHTHRKN